MSDSKYRSLDGDHAKDLDAEQVGPSGQEVFRQRVQISGSGINDIAEVTNTTPASDAYGLVVRLAGTGGGVGTIVDQGMPAALGSGWPVKITDGTNVLGTPSNPLRVEAGAISGAAVTSVAAAITSTTIIAANPLRRGLIIHNNSNLRFLYVKLGTSGDDTDFTLRISPRGTWEFESPIYLGEVSGVWTTGTGGTAQVTELT